MHTEAIEKPFDGPTLSLSIRIENLNMKRIIKLKDEKIEENKNNQ